MVLALKNKNINLSRLSFGTSGIMGSALTDRGRVKLLDAAYDNGITHFDTAPLYGQGDAEKVLGSFYKTKQDGVTIATKYGLMPKKRSAMSVLTKPMARFVNRKYINIKRRNALKNTIIEADVIAPKFTRDQIVKTKNNNKRLLLSKIDLNKQLETSLYNLKTETIDVYFLHDVSIHQLCDEFVVALLSAKDSGKVREIGLATSRANAYEIKRVYPEISSVIQVPSTRFEIENDLYNDHEGIFISHSSFNSTMNWLLPWVTRNYEALLEKSLALGVHIPPTPFELYHLLLLQRALQKNTTGSILFSSSKVKNIEVNTKALSEDFRLLDLVLDHLQNDAH